MRLHYEAATFRMRVGPHVTVEVTIHGCESRSDYVLPVQLTEVSGICDQLAEAIERITAAAASASAAVGLPDAGFVGKGT